jgi:hypothetical protein
MNKKEVYTMSKRRDIPKFNSEDEECEFWGKEDSTEYIEWDEAEQISFSKLKHSTQNSENI